MMKCGPDECPIVAFSDLTPAEQRTERKRIAEKMYKQGFTEQQIATQLGVTQQQISLDIEGLQITCKPPRPKGGRPKGSTSKERRKNTSSEAEAAARAVLDDKMTYPGAEKKFGVTNIVLRSAVAREEGRREPVITPEMLSMSAQQKLDMAIRIHTARLNKQFEQRVNEEVHRRIAAADNAAREQNKDLRKENMVLQRIVQQRGVFTLEQFRQMQMLCHPDSSASERTKAQLSQILAENKIRLIKEAA